MPPHLVYVGTYTDPSSQAGYEVTPERPVMGMTGPTGAEGIYVFRQDPATGALAHRQTVPGVVNPSFLALDPGERFLFAVNETRETDGAETGAVSSFALDAHTGVPRFLSQQHSGGSNPCHLAVSPDGRFLLVANHEHGRVAVLPIDDAGRLAPATDIRQDEPRDPAGQRRPHAHFVTPDPEGQFVLSTDTGTDRISVYRLDPLAGRLKPNQPPWGETHPGGSPRHLAFHPSGRYLYANGEADLTLSVFAYAAASGSLTPRQHLSTIPDGVIGRLSTAQIAAHPNGRFVYVSNRGHDSIAIFRIDPTTGEATRIANEPTRGQTPRNFALDPDGRFLYVANQNSASIVCFRVDQATGLLAATGHVAEVPAPTCILFTRGPGARPALHN
jgi:6-phosphogluconolactonase